MMTESSVCTVPTCHHLWPGRGNILANLANKYHRGEQVDISRCRLELQTNVKQRFATISNHGMGPQADAKVMMVG